MCSSRCKFKRPLGTGNVCKAVGLVISAIFLWLLFYYLWKKTKSNFKTLPHALLVFPLLRKQSAVRGCRHRRKCVGPPVSPAAREALAEEGCGQVRRSRSFLGDRTVGDTLVRRVREDRLGANRSPCSCLWKTDHVW